MIRTIPKIALCALAIGLFPKPAQADSAASLVAEQDKKLNEYGGLGDVNMYCKHKFKVSIDAKSFSKVIGQAKNEDKAGNLYNHCSKPLTAVKDWCALGYAKEVKEQISSYVCRYSAGKPQMSLKKGVLTMTTNWEREQHDWTKQSVGNVLRKGGFTLTQAALIKNDNGRIKSANLDMKRRCKHEVKWKVDWKSFTGELNKRIEDDNRRSIWQHCLGPLAALEDMCSNNQAKLMANQVSSYVCRFDKNAGAKMVLSGKTLTFSSNMPKNGVGVEKAKELVADTLRDGAFSVRQAAFMRDEDAHLQRLYSSAADSKCSTKIAWNIDWKSLEGEVDKRLSKEDKTSIYAACGVPLDRISDVCGSDRKNKVKQKIKSYTCVLGGKGKSALALKNGKLIYAVDFGVENAYGMVDKFLVKNRVIKKKPKPKKLSPKDLAKIRRILGQGAATQGCYRRCDRVRGARAKQRCRNTCQ